MIFISRELKPDSPLLRWARERQIPIEGRSFLRFSGVEFEPPAGADWWFFYSPRAVRFAGPVPQGVRVGAIGGGTAKTLLARGARVDFCGNGQPQPTAEDFLAVGEGQRVFFPHARHSRRSIQSLLAGRLTVLDAVCYDNRAVPPAAAIEADVYIFTSPLNVTAYLDHWPLSPGARVLAIGPSTAEELTRRGVSSEWPAVASEEALLSLLNNQVLPPPVSPT